MISGLGERSTVVLCPSCEGVALVCNYVDYNVSVLGGGDFNTSALGGNKSHRVCTVCTDLNGRAVGIGKLNVACALLGGQLVGLGTLTRVALLYGKTLYSFVRGGKATSVVELYVVVFEVKSVNRIEQENAILEGWLTGIIDLVVFEIEITDKVGGLEVSRERVRSAVVGILTQNARLIECSGCIVRTRNGNDLLVRALLNCTLVVADIKVVRARFLLRKSLCNLA